MIIFYLEIWYKKKINEIALDIKGLVIKAEVK